ncbi:Ribosomal protein S6 kinase delta-1 [Folsomia candida]|uniref:Ribosomal protein S6 kinase delta-1 n=2 Tax=Folsomia candida TaxID=158441 RepID=A0A226EUJ0_FOLCA|nr:Ribosomal protein S6 kinase delta-1 [Folsomia candida]
MMKRLDGKDIWIRKFEISEHKRHKKGFTAYKVVSTVFPRNFPDGATKITVWKRYKDFKALHKELEALFVQLYLKGKFPQLPTDKFFGRFDHDVIERRRIAALELLEFSATFPQLFLNKIFVNFFEDGLYPRDFVDAATSTEDGKDQNVRVEAEDINFEDCLIPEKVWQEVNPGEGVDECSSPSFSAASPEPNSVSNLDTNFSLPIGSMVDNVSSDNINPVPDSSELMLLQHHPDQLSIPVVNHTTPNPIVVTFSDIGASLPTLPNHSNNGSNSQQISTAAPSPYSLQESKHSFFKGSTTSLNEDLNYLEEFDFCQSESSPHIPNSSSTSSLNTCGRIPKTQDLKKSSLKKYTGFNLFDFLPIFTKKQDKLTDEQNLSNSLSSYIREAAGFISVAQHYESDYDYAAALNSYTEGIRVLLEGAQCDQDIQRRALVKRKVEKYLSHAEELKQKVKDSLPDASLELLRPGVVVKEACVGSIESHADDDFVMIKSNVISSSIEELKNFKVVGSTYNNILVAVDITAQGGPDCFAIKVLRKSSSLLDPEKPTLIPNTIPFMVQLLKWFNTEDGIILVLQYAAGGRLLNFVQSYQTKELSMTESQIQGDPKFQTILPTPSYHSSLPSNVNLEQIMLENQPISIGHTDTLTTSHSQIEKENLMVTEKVALDQLQPKINKVPLSSPEEINRQKFNWELESVLPPSTPYPNTALDLQTDALLENSRELLKTVSKTLETQKKATTTVLDSSIISTSLDIREESSLSSTNRCMVDVDDSMRYSNPNISIPAAFMVPNPSNNQIEDSQCSATPSLPARAIPERCVKIWAAELVIALDKLHSQGITYG